MEGSTELERSDSRKVTRVLGHALKLHPDDDAMLVVLARSQRTMPPTRRGGAWRYCKIARAAERYLSAARSTVDQARSALAPMTTAQSRIDNEYGTACCALTNLGTAAHARSRRHFLL
jgi:glycerol kinase